MPRKGLGPIAGAKGKRQKDNARALVKFAGEHDRLEVAHALQLCEDPTMRQLGDALTDRAFDRTSLATMARNYGISYKKIATVVFESKVDEGKMRMAPHMPKLMEDIALDSLSGEKQCGICQGTGFKTYGKKQVDERTGDQVDLAEECKECGGRGLIRVVGDTNARKMVMETAGLVGKGVSVDARSVTVNNVNDLEGTLALVKKVREVQRAVQPTQPGVIDATD